MALLETGIVATSHLEHGLRVALHPEHLGLPGERLSARLIFEVGYGDRLRIDEGWRATPALSAAVQIERGHVRNPKVLSYQAGSAVYPHEIRS